MHTDRITYLLERYLDDQLSPEEMQELRQFLAREEEGGAIHATLAAILEQTPAAGNYRESDWDPLVDRILGRKVHTMKITMRKMMSVAALLIMVAGAAWWILAQRGGEKELVSNGRKQSAVPQDIAPGRDRATLTLSDSSTIDLDLAKDGLLQQEGDLRLVKHKNGQLAYQAQAAGNRRPSGAVTYNVLTTPRGGQYQLILPDGSKVWLNAASSLKYPTGFTGKERSVELKGEAYFEIAKNAAMPFRVSVIPANGGEPVSVHVLGTHFNINAYADEATVGTTLLEGSVKVQKGASSLLLKPGERASVNGDASIGLLPADVEEVVAWKNGLFKFNEATIEAVMRQVARWYDVEVVYVNSAPKDLFRGEMYRNVPVSTVLKVLEASGVQFTVEGKKILVK